MALKLAIRSLIFTQQKWYKPESSCQSCPKIEILMHWLGYQIISGLFLTSDKWMQDIEDIEGKVKVHDCP